MARRKSWFVGGPAPPCNTLLASRPAEARELFFLLGFHQEGSAFLRKLARGVTIILTTYAHTHTDTTNRCIKMYCRSLVSSVSAAFRTRFLLRILIAKLNGFSLVQVIPQPSLSRRVRRFLQAIAAMSRRILFSTIKKMQLIGCGPVTMWPWWVAATSFWFEWCNLEDLTVWLLKFLLSVTKSSATKTSARTSWELCAKCRRTSSAFGIVCKR